MISCQELSSTEVSMIAVFTSNSSHLIPLFSYCIDDILLTSNDKSELTKVKVELKRKFEMKDLGAANKILGIEIKRE